MKKYKVVWGRFLIIFLVQISCKSPDKNINVILNNNIDIYKVHFQDTGRHPSVSGIVFLNNKLYYLKNDTMLMTYKSPPIENAKIFVNNELLELLQKTNLKKLKENGSCNNCAQHSKDDFVIRFASTKGTEEFVLPGGLTCDPESPCIVLQKIDGVFRSFEH